MNHINVIYAFGNERSIGKRYFLVNLAALVAISLSACDTVSLKPESKPTRGGEVPTTSATGENGRGISRVVPHENTEKRYALIIGNNEYKGSWDRLNNPVNDARDMKNALVSLPPGKRFEVDYLENASQQQMEEAVTRLGTKLKAAGGVGLFYYAGHGSQIADNRVEGKNYLIPVDLTDSTEAGVKYRSMKAEYVLETLQESGNKFNIVILDACRTNGLSRGKTRGSRGGGGLAEMPASEGTIIAFSTQANNTAEDGNGKNSPYAKHLVAAINQGELTLEQMFKQVRTKVKEETGDKQSPVEYTKLEGDDFCFVSCPGTLLKEELNDIRKQAEEERRKADEALRELERERMAREEAEGRIKPTDEQAERVAKEAQKRAEEAEAKAREAERRAKEAEERLMDTKHENPSSEGKRVYTPW